MRSPAGDIEVSDQDIDTCILNAGTPGKTHRDAHLALDEIKECLDPVLAARCQRIDPSASQQDAMRPERKHAQYIKACPNARVGQYGEIVPAGMRNFRNSRCGRWRTVQLPAAVV